MRQITEGAGWQVEQIDPGTHTKDRDQRRGHTARQAWQQIDNRHGQRHQAGHQVQRRAAEPGAVMLEMLELGQGDDDCQTVDETEHHRIRHHAHQLAQAQQAEGNHDQPAEQYRGQQVLHTVLHHQGDDDHGHRPGRAGNHPGATTEQGGEGADNEGAIKAH
ncbi:hypothetical protein D3C72_1720890 [compost metagenome]